MKAALGNVRAPYSLAELTPLAEHCTRQEDAANKVERRVRKSAAALWLADRIGQEFDAVVPGASEKGTWVRLLRPPVEGKLERGFEGLDIGRRCAQSPSREDRRRKRVRRTLRASVSWARPLNLRRGKTIHREDGENGRV